MTDSVTVLIVEDEDDLAEVYTEYLAAEDEYDVLTATGGPEAVEKMSDEVDVVLLDRRMPVMSGNEVLASFEEEDYDCRIAMVTAVDPDFDIVDLGIDDYVVKPIDREDVLDTVERLLKIDEYNERYQEFTSKKLKRNILEVEKTESELEESEEFARLESEIRSLKEELDAIAEELDSDAIKRQL